jgi:FkbH-like protein
MPETSASCLILSDFNAENLSGYLNNDPTLGTNKVKIHSSCAPYGAVQSLLLDRTASEWDKHYDALIVWTLPEIISPNYADASHFKPAKLGDVLDDVDRFSNQIKETCDKASCVIIPTWSKPFYNRGAGILDRSPGGLADLIARMNLRLVDNLADNKQVFVIDIERCLIAAGKYSFNPKMWYLAKVPFSHEVFQSLADEIKNVLDAFLTGPKKLLVLDLDNTLWGGIVGDAGWENLSLGGHDPKGEAFVDFQRNIKALTRRGVVLGVVSKNTKEVALQAIDSHPEMVLRRNDFAGWRINWDDKAKNLIELVDELNLGLQSVVFIDDNPVERSRVAEALPEVYVPEWPEDAMLYSQALLSLGCFDSPLFSTEDATRASMYAAERQRTASKSELGSVDEWLSSLEIVITWEEFKVENSTRILQLINKTNQFNLSTRRLTPDAFDHWIQQKENKLYSLRVKDRYGDSGLVGIVSVTIKGKETQVVDLILSCRVFGRKIEYLLLEKALVEAKLADCSGLTVRYLPTEKNKPTLSFLNQIDAAQEGPDYFFPSDFKIPDLNYRFEVQ